jgi:hypothetical protein
MNDKEKKQLQEYVKKRFDECEMDYKTFDADLDITLTYAEQKRIYDELLDKMLPKELPKRKKDIGLNAQQVKAEQEAQRKAEQEKMDAEIKARFEAEIEQITKDSKELEKLYHTPIKYIEMVASGNAKGLLLFGESSLGKSYRVKKVLKDSKVKDYIFVSGHITPKKFYEKLYQAKDSLVIFDDVDILGNLIILNMIKACLNENSNNVVEYHTSAKMDIPNSFVFNGRVIILLNDIPKRNEHLKAVESRVLKYHLKFTREEILKIIFEIAHKFEIDGTSVDERIMIAKWLKDSTTRATKNLNIRLYLQAVEFYKYDKLNWEELAREQIITDEIAELIIQGLDKDKWVEETGLSPATYKRIKKDLGLTRAYGVYTSYTE